jgi:hypothetical protein
LGAHEECLLDTQYVLIKLMAKNQEPDSVYFLKLVLYLIIGVQWFRISKGSITVPLPIGFIIGLLFARTDHFQIDRKIEYAILLVAMLIGFWLPIGFELILN